MGKYLEQLWPFFAPLLAAHVDQSATGGLALPLKRLLYNFLLQIGTEGRAWVRQTQTTLDDAGFDAVCNEAVKEWAEYGHSEVPELLDNFVAFIA